MWYEILPSFGIIVIAMGFPHGSAYIINKLVLGNMFRRDLHTTGTITQYIRDTRLTGNPYKVNGLESIPD